MPHKKIAIVTGASTGLGLSLSLKLLQEGYLVHGISCTQTHWKTAQKSVNFSSDFRLHQFDVTDENEVKLFFEGIKKTGENIHLLINNAGYASVPIKFENITTEEFKKNIDVNLYGTFLMCKYALPIMQNNKQGTIINISSMAGKRAVPELSIYSASKFGVLALSQALAKENIQNGIKCYTVCPGGMHTEMRAKLFGSEDALRQQTTDYVAGVIMQTISGEINIDSGGDIVIRHSKISAINPVPLA